MSPTATLLAVAVFLLLVSLLLNAWALRDLARARRARRDAEVMHGGLQATLAQAHALREAIDEERRTRVRAERARP